MTGRIQAFAPVAGEDARVLILGSMPSVASLQQGFYYGHPRNAFWRILSDVYGVSVPATIDDKKAMLIEHRIALWDVLESCEREGSLDSAIRSPRLNDFNALFKRCRSIERVLLNGGTAWRLFEANGLAASCGRRCMRMPSTSPAYTIQYERKLALWRHALLESHESV
ncbi:MAG: DNA-deoxyinosine glycosylase [Clostridia bacterium]|nr:DNA-deoxyinosine glycosylase [Clostridia bacterium]